MKNVFVKIREHAYKARKIGEIPEPFYLDQEEMKEFRQTFDIIAANTVNHLSMRYYGVPILLKAQIKKGN